MEAIKFAVNIDKKRQVVVDIPSDIPLGKAEIMIIIQPLSSPLAGQGTIELAARGISMEQAADMRSRVLSFEDDWNAPGMEVYDEL
jgi:hypothetical protein